MSALKSIITILLLVICIAVYMSIVIVNEGQQAIVFRMGQLTMNSQTGQPLVELPGIHWQWPIYNQTKIFDTRIQSLNVTSTPFTTQEQKNLLLDYYTKWRINNLSLYNDRTGGDDDIIRDLLAQKINDILSSEISKSTLPQIMSGDHDAIIQATLEQANSAANIWGITVLDINFQHITLPPDSLTVVYDTMRTNREALAAQYQIDGQTAANQIHDNADATVANTLATANATAAQIRGEGDALAAKIYADAYNKDPEFYTFYRSLNIFQNTFASANNILILKPDSAFFNYFNMQTTSISTTTHSTVNAARK